MLAAPPRASSNLRGVRGSKVSRVVVARHGHGGGPPPKGYLGDLRKAAIKLHTREQMGNKKDKAQAAEEPQERPKFEPKLLGYLRFLQESKLVFDCLEETVAQRTLAVHCTSDGIAVSLNSERRFVCAVQPFRHTGLERGAALSADIDWLTSSKGIQPLAFRENGPGNAYVKHLQSLAAEDVPAFVCHYYNVNFAHMAGGRMIGKSVSNAILDGAELEFYKYEGDSKELGDKVKEDIEAVAQSWSEEDRKRSVAQTPEAFSYSGALLKCITQACDCDCPRELADVAQGQEEMATA